MHSILDTLAEQAPKAARGYFKAAIRIIDDEFGEGYAKDHPELIAAFMTTSAQDMHTGVMYRKVGAAIKEAGDAVAQGVVEAAIKLEPSQ